MVQLLRGQFLYSSLAACNKIISLSRNGNYMLVLYVPVDLGHPTTTLLHYKIQIYLTLIKHK